MWDLPGPGLEPLFPALAGGFLTTVPPGKPCLFFYHLNFIYFFIQWVLISYLFYTYKCIYVNPNLPIHPTTTIAPRHFPPLVSLHLLRLPFSYFIGIWMWKGSTVTLRWLFSPEEHRAEGGCVSPSLPRVKEKTFLSLLQFEIEHFSPHTNLLHIVLVPWLSPHYSWTESWLNILLEFARDPKLHVHYRPVENCVASSKQVIIDFKNTTCCWLDENSSS